jgi:hypothetical protein
MSMGASRPGDADRRRARAQAIEEARRALDDAEAVADHLAGDAMRATERADHARSRADAAEREARRLRWEAETLLRDTRQIRMRAGEARREVGARLAALRACEQEHRDET